jgi:four helix bundle protein
MAYIKEFRELLVWQKARLMCNEVYEKLSSGSFSKDYGLKDQINRSSGSVIDNIAEGFDRDGRKEFIQFLSYAKASATEVRSQLYRALDRRHINEEEFSSIDAKLIEINKMIGGLMKYLKTSELSGTKFKNPHLDKN